MKIIDHREVNTQFITLLNDVIGGEEILITKNGKIVARLVPIMDEPFLKAEEAISRLRQLRSRLSKRGITIEELNGYKHQGRKW